MRDVAGSTATPRLVTGFGLFGVYSFALFMWLGVAGALIALAMALLAAALQGEAWRALWRDAVFRWLLVFAAYVLATAAWGARLLPEASGAQWAEAGDWLQLCLFVVVAWWLGGRQARMEHLWMLALAGLILGMVLRSPDPAWSDFLRQQRTGFQFPALAFALYSAVAILALVLFIPVHGERGHSIKWHMGRMLVWVAALLLMIQSLIATQSRATWLALALVLPLSLMVGARARLFHIPLRERLPILMLGGALLACIVWFNGGVILERMQEEGALWSNLLHGQHPEEIDHTSTGYRLTSLEYGVDLWLQRPWLGWGPGSVDHLIAQSGDPRLRHPAPDGGVQWLDHLHNTYLEILVRLGVVGATLMAVILWLILAGLVRAYRAGRLGGRHVILIAGGFALTALWSLFNFRALNHDWRFFWILLCGSAYTFRLHAARLP